MKRLLFIAHEYHQKTRSFEFLAKLLLPHYELEMVFLSPREAEADRCLGQWAGASFDVVLCFQLPPPLKSLKGIACEHVVFFPMFDHSGRWGIERWLPFRGLRIISFSKAMADRLRRWGFDAFHFQYFPDPGPEPPPGDPGKAFFWVRTEDISMRTFTALLAGSELRALHLHKVLDPGQAFLPPDPDLAARFRTDTSTWFETKGEMLEKIQECGVYFAPRMFEGIGHSFLEAMAMGRCVIAPDRPTMNEYITDGQTGLLYNPKRPAPLAIHDIAGIQQRTRAFMVAGHARWLEQSQVMIPLLEAPARAGSLKPFVHFALGCLTDPRKLLGSRRRLISIRIRKGKWKVQLFGWTWGDGTSR